MTFSGRTAVVTGAGSGIGRAIAEQLRDAGAHVIGVDIRTSDVPPGVQPQQLDLSDADAVERFGQRVLNQHTAVDVLMNNAGIGSTSDVLSCSVQEWDRLFAVNVRSVLLMTKAFLPAMLAQGRGAIVNTASVLALIGAVDRAAYSATKGAVVALTRQVAVQYAAQGVRCNCICPGTVDSPWVSRLLDTAPDPMEARARLVARQPVGRMGTPQEVAKAAVYLASDDAAFVTGSAFVIDGGYSAG